MKDNAMTSC